MIAELKYLGIPIILLGAAFFWRKRRKTSAALILAASLLPLGLIQLGRLVQTRALYCCGDDIDQMEPFLAYVEGVNKAIASSNSFIAVLIGLCVSLTVFSVAVVVSKNKPKPTQPPTP